ncbi:restriction endonuclease subunit S [uncultured Dokdonia sp.]|uniref:restriction endonuclease subunit S n=1 Tax=uncultured Dokdonia sp. TaxID=575653 RepID=UPI0030EF0A1B|tara:strand:+ start:12310 stop:13602 length:1293 start_codon:yes stop_codon:yes gene_type:complete
MSTSTTAIKTEKRSAERSRSKLIPELRFKEFDGEWVKNKLIDWSLVVLDGDRGSNYPSGDEFQSEGYCLFMNAKNVTKAGFSFEHKMFITKEKDEILRKGKLKREDLVLTTRGSVGHIAYYDQSVPFDNLRINSGMVLIRNENDAISSKFIYINFFSPNLIRQVSTISFGSAQPQLTVKEINKFKFNLPSLPEQQKIASFLSAVDQKIQQLTTKKELLEQYKKGVMQQMFSGQLRFKSDDGKDFPDWEEKRLGEVGKIITGSTPPTSNPNYYNGEYLFVSPADINTSRYIVSTKTSITQLAFSKGRKIAKGAVLFVCIGSTIGKVAQAGSDCITNQQINAIVALKEYSNEFIYSLLELFGSRIKLLAGVQAVPLINKTEFSKLKYKFPRLEEQKKIARYLSSIDTKIEAVTHQITQTQTFKKGLLQQMFV